MEALELIFEKAVYCECGNSKYIECDSEGEVIHEDDKVCEECSEMMEEL